jgi:hypothetical protein
MGERPLSELVDQEHPQVYRMLVIPRLSSPVVVRLSVEADGTGKLVAKIGQGELEPSPLTLNRTTSVSEAEIDDLRRLINQADFWSMPTQAEVLDRRTGKKLLSKWMGDSSWMLEAITERGYHLVDRGGHELGPLNNPLNFLLVTLAQVDLRSLPTQGPTSK